MSSLLASDLAKLCKETVVSSSPYSRYVENLISFFNVKESRRVS